MQKCLISLGGTPRGYVQFYPLLPEEAQGVYALPKAAWYGMDLFIGDPLTWGHGLGTRVISLVKSHVLTTLGAGGLAVDPQVDNLRAVRAYEKCGFRKVRVLARHELHEGILRDCCLMVLDEGQSASLPHSAALR